MHKRSFKSFRSDEAGQHLAIKALHWGRQHFETAVFLNSNNYPLDTYGSQQEIIALGADAVFYGSHVVAFEELKTFADQYDDWLFGFFSYELKNQLEHLNSKNPDHVGMPLAHFFRPVVLLIRENDLWHVGCLPGYGPISDPAAVFKQVCRHSTAASAHIRPKIRAKVEKQRYLEHMSAIRDHIQAGDIYEMNYCVEFFAEDAKVDPLHVYQKLNEASPTPFSCFYALDGRYLMCASPERFLRKEGNKLISQPIKGTSARGADPEDDLRMKQALYTDPKERSENVMIVDLVRNDLSRTAQKGSVQVEELFGIYSFRQVHQMISTVVSRLHPEFHYIDVIKNAFPMGSMTGAPKIRAMQLIDHYEDTRRGLYSGAVGYISPHKDFDFNVVIRSIQYNSKNKYLSFMAGSAVTIGSVPEKEYEECLLKATAMRKALH